MLSSTSRLWKEAVESRRVYDARVRYKSTETLVLLEHKGTKHHTDSKNSRAVKESKLALYSMSQNCCYEFSEMPPFKDGFQQACKFVSLNGNVYCLGGEERASSEMYVLDPVGQQQWKKCQSMGIARLGFACGVMDGKIYVCGGISANNFPVGGCEVYDPVKDAWASIDPKSFRFRHRTTTLGGELFVYGGMFYDQHWRETPMNGDVGADADGLLELLQDALFLEVYNPGKDEWRKVDPFGPHYSLERLFVAQGMLYLMCSTSIYVLDGSVGSNNWRKLHSFMFPEEKRLDCRGVLVVDSELLGLCYCKIGNRRSCNYCLFRSTGFGSETEELVWERANCPLTFFSPPRAPPFLCPIRL